MTSKGSKQTAPRRVVRFNREEASPGAWQYNDPDEEAFIFAALPTIDVSEVDDFLEGLTRAVTTDCHGQSVVGAPVVLSDEIIEALLERRQDAFDAFKAGNDDLMEARLDALSGWCHFVGFRAAARPEIAIAAQYRKQQSGAREDKPGTADDYDSDRNKRIRKHHAGLVAADIKDHIHQTALAFGLSESTIGRIVRKRKKGK